jgi:hypothetical protein
LNKVLRPKKNAPMEITTASRPFEKCYLDIVGPFCESSSRNKCILTYQDDLSKFIAAVPIPQQDAQTIATEFVRNIELKFGAPVQILTDQRPNFLSNLFKSVCKL